MGSVNSTGGSIGNVNAQQASTQGAQPDIAYLQYNSEGKIGAVTVNGRQISLNPPANNLEDLKTRIEIASVAGPFASSELAGLKGLTLSVASGMVPADAKSQAGVILNLNESGHVSGYVINGQVRELPNGFQGLTPAEFSTKVGQTLTGPTTELHGLSYTTSNVRFSTGETNASLYMGSNGLVYGYRDPSGTPQTLNPPQTLGDFLDNVNRAQSPSPLASLKGQTLSIIETQRSEQAGLGTISVNDPAANAAGSIELYRENMPPPGTAIRPNPYMQPSLGAALTVLLMEIASLKREIAMKEDEAIAQRLGYIVTMAEVNREIIQAKYDGEMAKSIGAIVGASISIVGACSALGMAAGAQSRYTRSTGEKGGGATQSTGVDTHTPQTANQAATQTPTRPANAADQSSPTKISEQAVQKDVQANQRNMDRNNATQEQRHAEAAGQVQTPSDPKGAKASGETETINPLHGQDLSRTQQPKDAAGTPGSKTAGAADNDLEDIPESDVNKKARIDGANNQFQTDQVKIRAVQELFNNSGRILEESGNLASIVIKSKAEQAEAYLNAMKQLNETLLNQLVSDRGQIDTDFRGCLDVMKQMMDREVQMLGQLFGVR